MKVVFCSDSHSKSRKQSKKRKKEKHHKKVTALLISLCHESTFTRWWLICHQKHTHASQKGKKEKRHKRKKSKKAKGGEDSAGPVQISKVAVPVAVWGPRARLDVSHLNWPTSFLPSQYLKDREKGKYSMISGKKIKMKVKKSKKDKQVSRPPSTLCDRVSRGSSHALASLCSGIKTEPSCLSSSTPPCDGAVGPAGFSAPAGSRKPSAEPQGAEWRSLQNGFKKRRRVDLWEARSRVGRIIRRLPTLGFSLVPCVRVEQRRPRFLRQDLKSSNCTSIQWQWDCSVECVRVLRRDATQPIRRRSRPGCGTAPSPG